MATRLYLANTPPDSGIAGFTVSGIGGWAGGIGSSFANTIFQKATIVKSSTSVTPAAGGGVTGSQNRLVALYVPQPLAVQTLTGTVKGQIRCSETLAANDFYAQLRVRIMSPDGSTQRGVSLDFINTAITSEFATSLTNRTFPRGGAASLTSQAVLAGDLLFIEIGFRKDSTDGSNVSMDFRDSAGADLAEDEATTTANDSWIEFSQTLVFAAQNPNNVLLDRRRLTA